MKILFVCRGNVGRSAMAEALFRKALQEEGNSEYEVASAGTKLSGPEQPLHEFGHLMNEVFSVMEEENIDIKNHVRRQLTEDMVTDADKIVLVVDERDPIPAYLENNPKVTKWDVLDPKGQTLEFTRDVKDRIKDFIKKFLHPAQAN
jgi:protein-tyrosine-phosphatase